MKRHPAPSGLEYAPMGVAVYHVDGTLLELNRHGAALFAAAGYPDRAELVGRCWRELFPHLHGTEFEEAFEELARDGVPSGRERVLPGFRGLHVYRVVLVRGGGDTVVVYFLELDELRGALDAMDRAEVRARSAQRELDTLKASYPFGAMAVLDGDFRYLDATGQGWDRLGIDPSTVVGRTLRERWDPETADRMEELVQAGLRGFQAEQRVPFGDRVFEIWAGPTPVQEGGPRCLIISKEVTDRVAREQQVRLLEEATDSVRMGITMADLSREDCRLVYASRGFLRLTGYDLPEVLGQNCRFLQGPDTDPASVRAIGEAIRRREPFQGVLLNYRKDGSSFWNRLTLTPFAPRGGVATHYVGIQEDVSEIREAEMARQHQRRLAELGTLAGSIAHDFNNILMEIQGRLAIATDGALPSRVAPELEGIQEAARSGSHLVSQLLAYARHQRHTPEATPAAALVRSIVPSVLRLLPRHVRVEMDVPETPLPVRMAPVQLEQVLLNLAKNAADAMPGGGQLTIAVRPDEEEPDRVVLTVSDTGAGMAQEVMDHAFEPFFTTKGSEGTGLGLSSVAQLVDRVGGQVEVESVEGEGTTFRIRLPSADPEELPARPERRNPRPAVQDLRDLRILLAEDQAGIRHVLARILRREGASVAVVENGEAALRVFREDSERPDLVLVDRDMPMLTGDRVIREIAREISGEGEDPWFVLMSGDLSSDLVEIPDHTLLVQKPFEIDAFIEDLRVLVSGGDPPGSP